ncbi:MAG: hypothetical protein AMXMBFR84_12020 [Candidatus Hydrogenedentota bacterium]
MFGFILTVSSICTLAASLEPAAMVNEPFVQERAEFFDEKDGLPAGRVTAIELDSDGAPLAGFPNSAIYRFDADLRIWTKWSDGPDWGAASEHDLIGLLASGRQIWAYSAKEIAEWDGNQWDVYPFPQIGVITGIDVCDKGVLIGGEKGIYLKIGDRLAPIPGLGGTVRALASTPQAIFVGTDGGLYKIDPGTSQLEASPLYPSDHSYSWAPRNVNALTAQDGKFWIGSENGAGMYKDEKWALYTGREGLPYNRFTCASSGGGIAWFGTEDGSLFFDGTAWGYRASLRWLPDNHVNDIAADRNGSAWVATNKGIAFIERFPITLAEKAQHFELIVDERHTRMGFVVRCLFNEPGELESAWINHTDNDGLYTAMYGASQAFRYGATKDPEAKTRARRCFEAMKLLYDVTGIPGFPARSVVPVNWPEDPNLKHNAAMNAAEKATDPLWKDILPRWPKSADGRYFWKCDTSSDEICGHYFFFSTYFDLVADSQEEKEEVAAIVDALTSHIVDNGFKLVDHDGLPTRWANWSPEYCNSIPGGYADRGLQAVEMLSFLNVAYHCTGNPKYLETAKFLRDNHAYHINAIYGRWLFPPDHVVPWDSNLAFLSYYPLLKYETDPALLRAYRTSLDRSFQFVARQNDPFFSFVFAAVFPDKEKPIVDDVVLDFQAIIDKAIPTLRSTPLLLIGWDMKNSHRLDVVQDPTPRAKPAYGWSVVTNEAIPIAERSHIRINSDHFSLDAVSGGTTEYEGTFYLLPYYMGMYHGFLK